MNASSKFRYFVEHYGWEQLHQGDREVMALAIEIDRLIFEQPVHLMDVGQAARSGERWSPRQAPHEPSKGGDDESRSMDPAGEGKEEGGEAAGTKPDGAKTYQRMCRSSLLLTLILALIDLTLNTSISSGFRNRIHRR